MITCLEETTAKSYFPLLEKFTVKLPDTEETFTYDIDKYHLMLSETSSVIDRAWKETYSFRNSGLAAETRKFLISFNKLFRDLQLFGLVVGSLPALVATEDTERSVLIEWIFNNFRVGFSIESMNSNSCWYLVSNKDLAYYNASGLFLDYASHPFKYAMLLIFSFVLTNG